MEDQKILVVYHAISPTLYCDDGFASALCAWMKFRDTAEYVKGMFSEKLPLDLFKGKIVYFLDFAYDDVAYMDAIATAAHELHVIDHHKTSAKNLADKDYAEICTSSSCCLLAWRRFCPPEASSLYAEESAPIPALLYHIDDNETWTHAHPHTRAFMQKLRTLPYSFEEWYALLGRLSDLYSSTQYYNEFIGDGILLLEQSRKQIETLAAGAFAITLDGIRGLAVNANQFFASEVGDVLANRSGTFGACFIVNSNSTVTVELRSVRGHFDVEYLSKLYGGGGHASSSSFTTSFDTFVELLIPPQKLALQDALRVTFDMYEPDFSADTSSFDIEESVYQFFLRAVFSGSYPFEGSGFASSFIRVAVNKSVLSWGTVSSSLAAKAVSAALVSLGFPVSSSRPRWYHKFLPYAVSYSQAVDAQELAAVLEDLRSKRGSNEDYLDALRNSVKSKYSARLACPKTRVTVTVMADSCTVRKTFEV